MLPLILVLFLADAPDPAAIVKRSIAAVEGNRKKERNYVYREHKVTRSFNKAGKEDERTSETWDVIGLEGALYRKLILRDEKGLDPKEQKREDERMQKEAARRRLERSQPRHVNPLSVHYSYHIPYDHFPEIYDLRMMADAEVAGRASFVVEGDPKASFKPSNPDEKEATNYHVRIWIDEADAMPARLETDVVKDGSRMRKGSVVVVDRRLEGDVWLDQGVTFNFVMGIAKMFTVRGEMVTTFSDYRKFQVDSRLVGDDR